MSVTTTQNPRAYSIVRTLADYELHHSEEQEPFDPETSEHPPPPSYAVGGGPEWETEYRRVPPWRPTNRELDFQGRNTYNNNIERFFIWNMFGGITIMQRLNKIWRATGGRVNNSYFRWQVGGEY